MQINYGKSWYIDGNQSIFDVQGNSINSILCFWYSRSRIIYNMAIANYNQYVCMSSANIKSISTIHILKSFSSFRYKMHFRVVVGWVENVWMFWTTQKCLKHPHRSSNFDIVIFTSITISLNGKWKHNFRCWFVGDAGIGR